MGPTDGAFFMGRSVVSNEQFSSVLPFDVPAHSSMSGVLSWGQKLGCIVFWSSKSLCSEIPCQAYGAVTLGHTS